MKKQENKRRADRLRRHWEQGKANEADEGQVNSAGSQESKGGSNSEQASEYARVRAKNIREGLDSRRRRQYRLN